MGDVVEATNVIRQVLSVDRDFADRRAPWPLLSASSSSAAEENGDSGGDGNYYAWRRKLLSRAARAGRLSTSAKAAASASSAAADRRGEYLTLRERLLTRRFPPQTAAAAAAAPSDGSDFDAPFAAVAAANTSIGSGGSGRSSEEAFAFAGLHAVFGSGGQSQQQQQRSGGGGSAAAAAAVTVVRFANATKDLLAFGCADGTVSVCTVVTRAARAAVLRGHFGAVTDLDWGLTNDFLVSAALDKTVRVWQSRCGLCTRIVQTSQACLCCCFHPLNNNFVALGSKASSSSSSSPRGGGGGSNGKGLVEIVNVSTGLSAGSLQTAGAVRALAFDTDGGVLFAGDEARTVTAIRVSANGTLHALRRTAVGSAPWSLEFKAWTHHHHRSGVRGGSTAPLVLAMCRDNAARVYRVDTARAPPGALVLEATLGVPSSSRQQGHARFCPLLATRPSACVVAGGEDGTVYIFDLCNSGTGSSGSGGGRSRPVLINKLQGHTAPVRDVSWSYDESLLATCDEAGIVLVWKRVGKVSPPI